METITRHKKKCCKEQKIVLSKILPQAVKFCSSCMEVISYEKGGTEEEISFVDKVEKIEKKTREKKNKIKDLDLFDL